MKKLTLIAVLIFALLLTSAVMAKPGVGNPTGTVTDIDDFAGTITIENEDGELFIYLPEDFDFDSIELDMIVTAKGEWINDLEFEAEWVKDSADIDEEDPEVEDPEVEGEEPAGEGNAWGEGGIYCAEGGKEEPHPMAVRIAEKYGMSEELVMEYVCQGMGFGDIMLAIKMGGGDAAGLLTRKIDGEGWGQIWKDMNLIGKDKIDSAPPGLLKKDEKPGNGPPEGKGPNS